MGDMADLEIARMEQGESIILIIETGKKIVVDNITLLYSNEYDDKTKYKILGDYNEDET